MVSATGGSVALVGVKPPLASVVCSRGQWVSREEPDGKVTWRELLSHKEPNEALVVVRQYYALK